MVGIGAASSVHLMDLSLSYFGLVVPHRFGEDEDDEIHAQVLSLACGDLGCMLGAQYVLKGDGPKYFGTQEAGRMESGVGRGLQRLEEEVVSMSLQNWAMLEEHEQARPGHASGPVVAHCPL